MDNTANIISLVNEAASLALTAITQYQRARAVAQASGIPDSEIAAADARLGAYVDIEAIVAVTVEPSPTEPPPAQPVSPAGGGA